MTRATGQHEEVADPATRRRGRRPAVERDVVLDAAEGLLADGGFDQLSVRRVADAVGVSRQVVYTHFGGVSGLLDALHQRLTDRLVEATGGVEAERGTDEYVTRAVAAYIGVARRWPELYQLVFERPVTDHVVGEAAAADSVEAFGHIVAMSKAWLERRRGGDVPTAEALRLARTIWSTTHGFVVVERVGFATVEETDALADAAIVALLAGWPTS